MTVSAHLLSLNSKKHDIEHEIEFEMKRPLPNFLKMSALKRKKLVIKEEISSLANNRKTA